MGARGLCCRGLCRGYPPSLLGHTGLLILRETCLGVWPQWNLQTELCGFVWGPCMSAESFASIKMNVPQHRTVSTLPSSIGFFNLMKIFIYQSSKSNGSWLYYCSDVERLVAEWPCLWFYGLGQLWQQRGVATHVLHSVVRLLPRWSEVQCQFSCSAWEAVNVCHSLCENLDPQGRFEWDKCLTRGAIKA